MEESDPLLPKLQYIEGFPILPRNPCPKTTTYRKLAHRPPPKPKPVGSAQSSKLKYIDGLALLPKTYAELAAARAKFPPVYFRDHTPGKCLHCTLTSLPCTSNKVVPSGSCGRCRRLDEVCCIRRPGTGRRIVTGKEAGDWVPTESAVERELGEDGARALVGGVIKEAEIMGMKGMFGAKVGERDTEGWCLPRAVIGGEGGDGFWRRALQKREGKEEEGNR